MEKIISEPWSYTLYKVGDEYLLEILCGSVGMYFMKIYLSESEKEKYIEIGADYIRDLSTSIQRQPSYFKNREI
jgi:hypothetical protein